MHPGRYGEWRRLIGAIQVFTGFTCRGSPSPGPRFPDNGLVDRALGGQKRDLVGAGVEVRGLAHAAVVVSGG